MTDFQAKRRALEGMYMRMVCLQADLFPVGGRVAWKTWNGIVETGTVKAIVTGGRLRVIDDRAQFQTTITTADILRAKP